MTKLTRTIIAMALLTAVAAAAGGWMGIRYGLEQSRSHTGLDDLLHHELNLTADQNQRIEQLEAEFATTRRMREDQMRAASRELATAIAADPTYGERAQAAIDRFHAAESALQVETVKHVLAMRTVLTEEQIRRFDEAISKALTSDPS